MEKKPTSSKLKQIAKYLEKQAREIKIEEEYAKGNERWLHPSLDGEVKL